MKKLTNFANCSSACYCIRVSLLNLVFQKKNGSVGRVPIVFAATHQLTQNTNSSSVEPSSSTRRPSSRLLFVYNVAAVLQPQPIHLIVADVEGSLFPDDQHFHEWLNGFFELQIVVRCTPVLIHPPKLETSKEQARADVWMKVGRILKREWNAFEGAVVVLPAEEFSLAVGYIRLMLGPIGKPVLFVQQNTAAHAERSQYDRLSFHASIINAAQAAIAPCSGTVVVSGSEIIDATPCTTPSVIGRIDFGLQLNKSAQPRNALRPSGPFVYPKHLLHIHTNEQESSPHLSAVAIPPLTSIVLLDGPTAHEIARALTTSVPIIALQRSDDGAAAVVVVESGVTTSIPPMNAGAALAKSIWIAGVLEQEERPEAVYGQRIPEILVDSYARLPAPALARSSTSTAEASTEESAEESEGEVTGEL